MFLKKEKTTTKMYKRIEKLYNKMNKLNLGTNAFYFHMVEKRFKSNLGERIVVIEKEVVTNKHNKILDISYVIVYYELELNNITNIGYLHNTVFRLNVSKDETKIQPCPISLTAHEIDLAILEFENYIDEIYNEHIAKQYVLSR